MQSITQRSMTYCYRDPAENKKKYLMTFFSNRQGRRVYVNEIRMSQAVLVNTYLGVRTVN